MSSLDFDLDAHMNYLEMEWRRAHESWLVARSDCEILEAREAVNANLANLARERLDRAEALKARILAKMERLDANAPDRD
jgi:hypothetical protein